MAGRGKDGGRKRRGELLERRKKWQEKEEKGAEKEEKNNLKEEENGRKRAKRGRERRLWRRKAKRANEGDGDCEQLARVQTGFGLLHSSCNCSKVKQSISLPFISHATGKLRADNHKAVQRSDR